MLAIRNPAAHESGFYSFEESSEIVALASLLARLIDGAELASPPSD